MDFVRAEVDYDKVLVIYKNRSFVGIKGWRYFPYVIEILALRELKVKNRAIADWLNTVVPHDTLLTNNTLVSYISAWKIGGHLASIDRQEIIKAKQKIINLSAKNTKDLPKWAETNPEDFANIEFTNNKFNFTMIDLLKNISSNLNKELDDDEKNLAIKIFKEDKNILEIDAMRLKFIRESLVK